MIIILHVLEQVRKLQQVGHIRSMKSKSAACKDAKKKNVKLTLDNQGFKVKSKKNGTVLIYLSGHIGQDFSVNMSG